MSDEPSTLRPSDLDLLHQAAGVLTAEVTRALVEHELTVDQWRVLIALTELGQQTMTTLARATHITGPTLSRVVDRLVERALAYRNVDAADRRRVVVHISDRGRRVRQQVAPLVSEAERVGLSRLSSREARTLRGLLQRITSV